MSSRLPRKLESGLRESHGKDRGLEATGRINVIDVPFVSTSQSPLPQPDVLPDKLFTGSGTLWPTSFKRKVKPGTRLVSASASPRPGTHPVAERTRRRRAPRSHALPGTTPPPPFKTGIAALDGVSSQTALSAAMQELWLEAMRPRAGVTAAATLTQGFTVDQQCSAPDRQHPLFGREADVPTTLCKCARFLLTFEDWASPSESTDQANGSVGGSTSPAKTSPSKTRGGDLSPGRSTGNTSLFLNTSISTNISIDGAVTESVQAANTLCEQVKAAVRARQPFRLEATLRQSHGSEYMRIIKAVRRDTGLAPADRHKVETELAARMVRARAIAGDWHSGVLEIRSGIAARELEKLKTTLAKWNFAPDDPEVAEATAVVQRWERLLREIPQLLQTALEERNIPQLRSLVADLVEGPSSLSATEAQKLLDRYDAQVRALTNAIAAGDAKAIFAAMSAWSFDVEDAHCLAGKEALERRVKQKEVLLAALQSRNGAELALAVYGWAFEKDDEDYLEAKATLEAFREATFELARLTNAESSDLVGLSDVVSSWSFADEDPTLQAARSILADHVEVVRTTLRCQNCWAMQGLWAVNGGGRALFGDLPLREKASEMLRRYAVVENQMQQATVRGNEFSPEAACEISQELQDWPFDTDDPNVGLARLWLELYKDSEGRSTRRLNAAVKGTSALTREAFASHKLQFGVCPEAGPRASEAFDLALLAVGSVALGVGPKRIDAAAMRSRDIALIRQRLATSVVFVRKLSLAELKYTNPSPEVHGVLEMVVHLVAGVDPQVRQPPRDTSWKSCSHRVSNASALAANLAQVPERIVLGHGDAVAAARAVHDRLEAEVGEQLLERLRVKSAPVAHLLSIVRDIFEYVTALQAAAEHDDEDGGDSGPSSETCSNDGSEHNFKPGDFRCGSSDGDGSAATQALLQTTSGSRLQQEAFTAIVEAKRDMVDSTLLSAAWVSYGGDVAELDRGLDGSQRQLAAACAAEAVARAELRWMPPLRANLQERVVSKSGRIDASSEEEVVAVTVRNLLGNKVAELNLAGSALVSEIKTRVDLVLGIAAQHQRFLFGADLLSETRSLAAQGLSRAATVVVICMPRTLSELIEMVVSVVSAADPGDFDVREITEAVSHLVFGQGVAPARGKLQAAVIETAHAAVAVLHERAVDSQSKSVRVSAQPMHLSQSVVQTLQIPLANLAFAVHSIRASFAEGCGCARMLPAIAAFVAAMRTFYLDWVPQLCVATTATALRKEADAGFSRACDAVDFARSLAQMAEPCAGRCECAEGVTAVTRTAATQLRALARRGLVLPTMHVESVRRAVDEAGAKLLSNPPAADAGARLRWAEAAMAVQLAPREHLCEALTGISTDILPADLVSLAEQDVPLSLANRLLTAAVWVVRPDNQHDCAWCDLRQFAVRSNASDFAEILADWNPVRDASFVRLDHASHVLLELWNWAAAGCGGYSVLSTLFAWVALAVTLRHTVAEWQRLLPVHGAVLQSIQKVDSLKPEEVLMAQEKAWSRALFLFDGPGEPWWWLELIRPSAHMSPPWLNSEDGGVWEKEPDGHGAPTDLQFQNGRRSAAASRSASLYSPQSSVLEDTDGWIDGTDRRLGGLTEDDTTEEHEFEDEEQLNHHDMTDKFKRDDETISEITAPDSPSAALSKAMLGSLVGQSVNGFPSFHQSDGVGEHRSDDRRTRSAGTHGKLEVLEEADVAERQDVRSRVDSQEMMEPSSASQPDTMDPSKEPVPVEESASSPTDGIMPGAASLMPLVKTTSPSTSTLEEKAAPNRVGPGTAIASDVVTLPGREVPSTAVSLAEGTETDRVRQTAVTSEELTVPDRVRPGTTFSLPSDDKKVKELRWGDEVSMRPHLAEEELPSDDGASWVQMEGRWDGGRANASDSVQKRDWV